MLAIPSPAASTSTELEVQFHGTSTSPASIPSTSHSNSSSSSPNRIHSSAVPLTAFPRLNRKLLATTPELADPVADWRYEMRREAQEILPGLFVGPYQSSRSLDTLHALAISHIVCISDRREAHLVKPRFPHDFVYLSLEVRDAQDQNLIRLFPQ